MNIPKKFYQGEGRPVAHTVGELKALLNELPDNLPVSCGFADVMELVVYNFGSPDMNLQIREPADAS